MVITKYDFMNGTICSVTLNDIYETNVPGVLFAYSENGYQGYTLKGNSLEPFETKHITTAIDYAGQEFPLDFYYCMKDGQPAVLNNTIGNDTGYAYIKPYDYTTEKVLITLYHYDMENLENRENGVGTIIYPLIMDINTLETTDFISSCGISDSNDVYIINFNLNESLSRAIISTIDGDIYYLDINSSSFIKLAIAENCYLNSAYFYNDETIIYGISNLETNMASFYEYSINTNTARKCCEIDIKTISYYVDDNIALLENPDNTCSIVNIRTGTSTVIPDMQLKDVLNFIARSSPDGRHILFESSGDLSQGSMYVSNEIKKIYIYDIEKNETTILNPSEYKDVYFTDSFWYDNNHIALRKEDGTPSKSGFPYIEEESKSTLWIFDINKLH